MLTLSELAASLIDRGIMLFAGVLATLIGFCVIPLKPKKVENEPRSDGTKRLLRWIGPFLIAVALILMVEVLIRLG